MAVGASLREDLHRWVEAQLWLPSVVTARGSPGPGRARLQTTKRTFDQLFPIPIILPSYHSETVVLRFLLLIIVGTFTFS